MSSLEERLKQFLPAIAKANIELQERIELQGKEIVQIDDGLGEDEDDSEDSDSDDDEEVSNNNSLKTDEEIKEAKKRKTTSKVVDTEIIDIPNSSTTASTTPQISLEFMLGEVDEEVFNALETTDKETETEKDET